MRLFRFLSGEAGASTIGYGLAVGLIAVAATITLTSVGTKTASIFSGSAAAIEESAGLTPGNPPGGGNEPEVPENQAPVIVTGALPDGALGQPYSFVLEATDPDGDDIAWTVMGLPVGLSADLLTGVISGSPDVHGVFTVSVIATDTHGATASENFSLTVAQCAPGSQVFSESGDTSWSMPEGCSTLLMTVAGAGGGGGFTSGIPSSAHGGNGGLVVAIWNEVPFGQNFHLRVGQGGITPTDAGTPLSMGGGRGGGYSAIFTGAGVVRTNALAVAGAGGGGGSVNDSGAHIPGGHGGNPGGAGSQRNSSVFGGGGATLTTGGARGVGNGGNGTFGVQWSGGDGGFWNGHMRGGSGGQGWFGGGGGGAGSASNAAGAAGGGGSNYISGIVTSISSQTGTGSLGGQSASSGAINRGADGYIILEWSE